MIILCSHSNTLFKRRFYSKTHKHENGFVTFFAGKSRTLHKHASPKKKKPQLS